MAFGDASGISFNYERLFRVGPNFILAGKFGIGYNEVFRFCFSPSDCQTPPERFISIPANLTMNFGKNKRFFEVGIGGSKLHGNIKQQYWIYPIIGYRVQPLTSGKFNFRVFGCFPFSGFNLDEIFFIPVGVSTGFVF